MRTSFANPEEASTYAFEEFPKPGSEVTEYSGMEGVLNYQLKGLGADATAYIPVAEATPVVKPAIFQDFKDVLPPKP